MANDTIFDKILRKEMNADIVYEDDTVLAFRDIQPQAPVHVLVIPKVRATSFADLKRLTAEQTGAFFLGVAKVAEQLGLEQDGYRVVVNTGPIAQQSVEYVHAHIIGGRQLSWPPG